MRKSNPKIDRHWGIVPWWFWVSPIFLKGNFSSDYGKRRFHDGQPLDSIRWSMIRGTKPPEGVGSPSTNLWKWKTPKAISRNVTWQLITFGLPWIPIFFGFFCLPKKNDGWKSTRDNRDVCFKVGYMKILKPQHYEILPKTSGGMRLCHCSIACTFSPRHLQEVISHRTKLLATN